MPVAPVTPVNGESLKLGLELRSPSGAPHKRAHGTHQQKQERYVGFEEIHLTQSEEFLVETSWMPEFVRHPQLGVGLPPTIQVTSAPIIQSKNGGLGKDAEHFHPKCGVFTVGPFFQRLCCQLGWGRHSFFFAFLWGSSLKTIFVPAYILGLSSCPVAFTTRIV